VPAHAPDDPEVATNASAGLLESGHVAAAVEAAETACRLAPQYANAWFNLALALQAAHRADDARKAGANALRLSPDDPRMIGLAAQLEAQTGNLDAARERLVAAVARFPQDGDDVHALLRCADIAMYTAKDAQTDYKIYAAQDNHHSLQRLSVHADIRHALVSNEIVVHYQPIIDLDGLTVRGAEGLVRWQHPEHGLIPPGAFVQTIEQTGLIGPLTRHVLERAIAECATWRRDGREMSVAVNLSVRNLLDRDLPGEIERLLDAYGLPAGSLQLEITESMIMSDPDRALATVSRLSGLGVRLSVDDFGTGYSSLANLRKMPIDELKIDRSFVSPMLRDESDLIIVRSTINLGHDLGLNVIAEGVEDSATLESLAELGCDLAQGYHVSRPMPADAFNAWLTHSARHGTTSPMPAEPGATAPITRGAVDLAGVTVSAPER